MPRTISRKAGHLRESKKKGGASLLPQAYKGRKSRLATLFPADGFIARPFDPNIQCASPLPPRKTRARVEKVSLLPFLPRSLADLSSPFCFSFGSPSRENRRAFVSRLIRFAGRFIRRRRRLHKSPQAQADAPGDKE